jgi:hypothetical protein
MLEREPEGLLQSGLWLGPAKTFELGQVPPVVLELTAKERLSLARLEQPEQEDA